MGRWVDSEPGEGEWAMAFWPTYRREMVRCLVQYADLRPDQAALLVDMHIEPPVGEYGWLLFHELPWTWAMGIVGRFREDPPDSETQDWLDHSPKLGSTDWADPSFGESRP